MWDAEGRRYIDYIGSWGPMILGHGHPAVLDAVLKAAHDGFSFGAPTEAEVELAEAIIAQVPSVEQLRLVSSGTEAAMSALRLARGATGRSKIVKFEGCYHGHADALLVKAGSGLATFGHPTSAGVPRRGGARHARARVQQPRAAGGGLRRARRPDRLRDGRADRRQHELRARQRAVHGAAARAVLEARRAARPGRGDERLSRRARQRAKPVRPGDPRLRARHQRVRQGHRRRHAAGRVRRLAQGDGPAGAAGPGLPGRHAQRQPGGHRLRPGHLARDRQAGLLRGAGRAHPLAGRRADDRGASGRGAAGRRQRGRHVRVFLRRCPAAELRRGDGPRHRRLQPLLPRHAAAWHLPGAGDVRGRFCQRGAFGRRHRRHRERRARITSKHAGNEHELPRHPTVHRWPMARRARRQDAGGAEPGQRPGDRPRRPCRHRRPRRRAGRRAARLRNLARHAGGRTQRGDAPRRRADARTRRRHRPADDAGTGQAAGRGQGRD